MSTDEVTADYYVSQAGDTVRADAGRVAQLRTEKLIPPPAGENNQRR